jgi:signal transduction histidine kinase
LIRNPLVDRQDYLNLERIADTVMNRSDVIQGLATQPGEMAQRIDEIVDVRVLLISPERSILADSRGASGASFGPLALRVTRLSRGIIRDQSGKAWLFVSRSLQDDNLLLLATPRRGVLSLLILQRWREILRDDIFPPFCGASVIAIVLALAMALGMARWVANPLQRISNVARQLAHGEYLTIQPEGPQEVKELAQSFNEMSDRVQATRKSQQDFVANVSHELKTPLTSIQGFSQALMEGTAQTQEEVHHAANVIYSEAERMHSLVLDLLDLARFDAKTVVLDRAPVDIPGLVKNIASRFEPQAGAAQVTLQWEAEPMPVLTGDGDRLAQVINNLVDNALKFTPAGGQVIIQAHPVGDQAEISVSDTGPGISKEEISRIFERFYQTDKARRGGGVRGAGLGLAIAREIVLAHGGQIYVRSNLPQGSQFVVKIPFAPPGDSTLAGPGVKHAKSSDHRAMLQ